MNVKESTNSLSKVTLATGGTPTSAAPTASGTPQKVKLNYGDYAFEGDDLTDAAAPGDMMSGQAPGITEAGGMAHFKFRVLPVITH